MCEENCAPKCEDLNVDFGWLDPHRIQAIKALV